MNFASTKLTKGLLAGSLAFSMLLTGCSETETPVTEENAPTDLLKSVASINSDTESTDMREVLLDLIQATSDNTKYGLIFNETTTSEGLNKEEEIDTLKVISQPFKSYDVRYGADGSFYEVYEEESSEGSLYRMMDSATQTITTLDLEPAQDETNAFAKQKAKFTIGNISVRESGLADADEERLKESITSAITYPLYDLLGSGLLIQPMARPDEYDFTFNKKGNDYIWTVTMKDQEDYNALVDTSYQVVYMHDRKDIRGDGSFVLDTYTVDDVKMELVMDENGCLKSIEYLTKSSATKGEETAEMTSSEKVTLTQAPESWTTFFKNFFTNLSNESLKDGDTFTLFGDMEVSEPENSTNASSQSSTTQSKAFEETTVDSKTSSEKESTSSSSQKEAKDSSTASSKTSKASSVASSSVASSTSSEKK